MKLQQAIARRQFAHVNLKVNQDLQQRRGRTLAAVDDATAARVPAARGPHPPISRQRDVVGDAPQHHLRGHALVDAIQQFFDEPGPGLSGQQAQPATVPGTGAWHPAAISSRARARRTLPHTRPRHAQLEPRDPTRPGSALRAARADVSGSVEAQRARRLRRQSAPIVARPQPRETAIAARRASSDPDPCANARRRESLESARAHSGIREQEARARPSSPRAVFWA